MNYLRAIEQRQSGEIPDGFPFNLPVIESLQRIEFTSPVTFFVGENGSGKSTVMEALAAGMRAPAIGSAEISQDATLQHARRLAQEFRFIKSRKPRQSFFFRAEDAFGFTKRVQKNIDELTELSSHFEESLSGYGRMLATGMAKGQRQALTDRYGEDPDALSHGEWFLSVLRSRLNPRGLYLLDEPETPLSPIHQLTLLSILKEMVAESCQFIIATHSPILMALKDAIILDFDATPVAAIEWQDVEHVALTKAFLNDPEAYLRHL
jgi:predicted ATPase|tara:strand:+ start:11477 stop:12271 length:795 start_codon:yes stop_codon:yes gene_type:complete